MHAGSSSGPSETEASIGTSDQGAATAIDAHNRTLFELAPDGLLIADPQGRYLDANPGICRMLGYNRDELVGMRSSDIVAADEAEYIAPALDAIKASSGYQREWTFRRKDGTTFDADVHATPMPDGNLLAVVRDVSDSRRAHEYSEHLVAIVESSGDAIIGKDLDGIITSWNGGAEAIFGYPADAVVGTSIRRLIPGDRQHEEDAILARLRSGERVEHFETRRQARDGRIIDVSITASPIRDARGQVIGASKIARDITEQKAREHDLQRITRLYAALSQVNQAIVWLRSRDELLPKVCQVLVQFGGFKMAWIGWHDPIGGRLLPVARCGDDSGYLDSIEVFVDERAKGHGPAGMAFRSAGTCISNDLLNDPSALSWWAEQQRQGLRSAAAFPIRLHGMVCATLNVYSEEAGFFQKEEIALLEEAAGDVSFALENEAREQDRQAATALALNEKRFSEAMIDSMPGIVYLYDEAGRFLRWNRNFEAVSGYSSEEIAGMHPLDFFPQADKAQVAGRIAEVLAGESAFVEADFLARNGSTTPYFFTGRRVEFEGTPCLVGVGIDISGRRRAEERLSESERKYRELVEHANSIILHWSREGRVLFLNEYGQRFFGFSEDEIRGRSVVGTIVPETDSEGRDLKQAMEEICRNPAAFEQNINESMRRSGERAWIAWTNKTALDTKGEVAEILSIGTDITAQIKAEEALRATQATLEQRVIERTAELESAMHAATAADRLKSAFLATMSHELRTPLNSIIGFTGILMQGLAGPLNPEQAKQMGMVRTSANHLLELINDVLDISRIEADQLNMQAQSFDLRGAIERAMTTVGPLAEKKGLALNLIVETPLGEMVSDRRRLSQVLINLLGNAIKFTERGSVTLSAAYVQAPDAPADQATAGTVRLQVTDTGIGMRPGELATLFKPFHQLDSGLTRQHEGTGLGLAISRRLCRLLGGDIAVSSEWGRGSTFTVTLPRHWTAQA
ncbi:PAS domain S-box protein [Thermomonas carbonis]|uniref:histidine kinase n=1 Tax=Thermomonas carbonis TaxID=1463158 RepID=A0A7G9STG8_9GAMM|nr:PAS domain S-box protein [Thermomonas carbonis]QNN71143.1 PAS domain S-box protein [Thermomonas carbonis]GHC11706.1 hypothetical protein GCM10010080_29430 [Thermomonas carbonis]